MKKILSAIAIGAAIVAGTGSAMAQDATTSTPAASAPTMANPFDASTWFDGAGKVAPGHIEAFNPADPESWMKFIDPKTHSKLHATFTNPASYGQFMNPGMYMQMMNPQVWMKWMNPNSYKVAMSGETMAYWMQPGAYMHVAQAENYMQLANPDNYTKLMDNAVKAVNIAPGQAGGFNFFNPASWMNAYSQGTTAGTDTQSADQG